MLDYSTLNRIMRPFQERSAAKARRDMAPFLESRNALLPSISPANTERVSGSFIYHRPPDYAGAATQEWGAAGWLAEFRRLQGLGIDTVIYQGALGETTQGRLSLYYPPRPDTLSRLSTVSSRLRRDIEVDPGLDDVFDAAEKCGLSVHLGLYNVLKGWFGLPNKGFFETVLSEELEVARDLVVIYSKRPAFAGWYISPEIMYQLHGKRRDLDMHDFLARLTEPLRAAAPEARIVISPGSYWRPAEMRRVEDFWSRTLKGSGVDTLCPQDSVGVLGVRPEDAPALWSSWARAAEASGVELWANCEAFERRSFGEDMPLVAAPFARYLAQLDAATPAVSKIVTWEAMYFLSPSGPPGAAELEAAYRGFFGLS